MRNFFIISLSILLSLSILGPSFLVLIDSHHDIEIAFDLGEEENQKESKKDLEEKKDTFLYKYHTPTIAKKSALASSNYFYLYQYRGYIIEVQSPPPKQIT